MSQEGRGCLVGDQGGSDKVAQFKMEGLRSGSDQRLCFRYTDSTIPLLPIYEISSM